MLCGRVKKWIRRKCIRNIPRAAVSESGGGGTLSFGISDRGIGVWVSWTGVVAAAFLRADLLSGLCSNGVPTSSTSVAAKSAEAVSSTARGAPTSALP